MKLRENQNIILNEDKTLKNVKNNIHKDHRNRLKTQFLNNGFESLTEIQKVELMLFYCLPQKDTNPIAHELLSKFGSISGILMANQKDLLSVKGIKDNSMIFFKLIYEIVSQFKKPINSKDIQLNKSSLTRAYAKKLFATSTIEQFYVICLTNELIVKKTILLQNGTVDEVSVDIRNITQAILDNNCNNIIICHNHPEGQARMSDNDCSFTYSLMCSCLLNSITITDHIIVGRDKTISLKEQGIIDALLNKALKSVRISNNDKLFLSQQMEKYIVCEDEKCD